MVDEKLVKQFIAGIFIVILLAFTFILIRPIFMSIVLGLILAYACYPIHKYLSLKIKNKTISALVTGLVVLAVIFGILWFSIPLLINQIFDAYVGLQTFDTIGLLKRLFPPFFSSPQVSANFVAAYNNFISNSAKISLEKLTSILINLPSLALKALVVLITFFYGLRDGDKLINLLKDSLPFNKATTNRFIQKSKDVTFSVVYGRVVIGIAVGILAGIGFFIAGVKSALLLSFLAIIASIIPMIGPWAIWIPVVVGLFVAGHTTSAIFLLFYSIIFVTVFENLATPLLVSKRSKLPTSLTLIGIIGGIITFGIFGILLGPLIVAYIVVLFEIYLEENVNRNHD
ncbi:AI-2E family transporter [Candidatus Pacearchaeota archaeon]|nr:AI-2E family transporter [Candidatus Pacearchaeota archaeon]